MTQELTEDDIYRTSTQYRLWSFSPEALSAQRQQTHNLAVERANRYLPGANDTTNDTFYPPLLAEAEELALLNRYVRQIHTTADHFKWPLPIKATASQYLRRFYLSNSCMTYPPKEIYKTVLFLACKSEATHMTLSEYARRISTDPESVLAAEYKVMQALRFTLEVRQPFRGLKGVLMELLNMAEGRIGGGVDADGRGGEEVAQQMRSLPKPGERDTTQWTASSNGTTDLKGFQDRIQAAYSAARTLLDLPASLTDAYFLYTPSQMLLAAFRLADEPLTTLYLSTKIPTSAPQRTKILATIAGCADLLASFDSSQILSKDERAALEEKLEQCRDPSTKDVVQTFKASRESDVDDEKAEKKKQAREKNKKEGEDLFGPSLG
jgi:cyclin H